MGTLAALVGGFAVGIFVHGSGDPGLQRLVDGVGVLGQLWVAALRMTVLPLVIALMLAAIVGARRERSIGALGAKAVVLFVTMHVGAVCLTLAVATPALASYEVDRAAGASFRAEMSEPARPRSPATGRARLWETGSPASSRSTFSLRPRRGKSFRSWCSQAFSGSP